MKSFHILAAVFLAIANVASGDRAVQPIVATLSFPYDSVLPGIPFDLLVTVKNVSDHAASVGIVGQLYVTLPDGTIFSPKDQDMLEPHVVDHPDSWVRLNPGESRQYAVTWRNGSTPNWTRYGEYSGPGTYDIAVTLAANMPPEDYVGTVRTNGARLRRVVSPGEDQALWERMKGVTESHWSDDGFTRLKEGQTILKEILQVHPTSAYYPYALLLQSPFGRKEDIPRTVDAADRFTNSPAYPYLLMHAAVCALDEPGRHDARTDEEYFALAEKYLGDVMKKTSNPALLDRAKRLHEYARTRGRGQRIQD